MPSSTMEAVAGGDTGDAEAVARVLEGIGHALERMVARNEQVTRADAEEEEERETAAFRGKYQGLAAFRGTRSPGISVGKYLERLWRYTGCSSSCFVVGFVYIDRAAHRHPASPVVSLNVHRLVLTSLLIASKVLDDNPHNNAFFAKVGGVSNAELNRMELELLFLLDFGLVLSSRVFESYLRHLEKEKMLARATQEMGRAIVDASANGGVHGLRNGSSRHSFSSPRCSIDW